MKWEATLAFVVIATTWLKMASLVMIWTSVNAWKMVQSAKSIETNSAINATKSKNALKAVKIILERINVFAMRDTICCQIKYHVIRLMSAAVKKTSVT